jgi:hypothetical protein
VYSNFDFLHDWKERLIRLPAVLRPIGILTEHLLKSLGMFLSECRVAVNQDGCTNFHKR